MLSHFYYSKNITVKHADPPIMPEIPYKNELFQKNT